MARDLPRYGDPDPPRDEHRFWTAWVVAAVVCSAATALLGETAFAVAFWSAGAFGVVMQWGAR